MTEIDYSSFGGWAISRELFDWICSNIPSGSTILELGSGTGTRELVKRYKVFSVEHDERWLNMVPEATYIYAPLKKGWYDLRHLKGNLPQNYDLLLVDGPVSKDRGNFIKHYKLFRTDIPIIFDDTNRAIDKQMSILLWYRLGKRRLEVVGGEKNFTVLI